jgi:hypothetical protein
MDTLRGPFTSRDGSPDEARNFDLGDEEIGREAPPPAIGQDERRMQVRAYNFWASMLDNRNFPSVDQLDPDALPDFGPFSVLLDFTGGVENPAIRFLGEKLAQECGADGPIHHLADVPRRSLLSRITDHYMQILANQAPIGFEAEFVNQRGCTILYRGILLPFAAADDRIDHIYGVINWKELADQKTTDELLLEIDHALGTKPEARVGAGRPAAPLTGWADGPIDDGGVLELVTPLAAPGGALAWPEPTFGGLPGDDPGGDVPFAAALDAAGGDDMGLADWLASARELAELAHGAEERTRQALYAAIGRAYDFSLAALAEPEEFQEMLADAGFTTQERAPLTPVVKLVFGADYDKTRLAEYASALGYAHRLGLPRGALADHLAAAAGGLKGVVAGERRLRREEAGKPALPRDTPRKALQRKLRRLAYQPLSDVSADGGEFTLLLARRLQYGQVVLLGEVSDDVQLLERAARKLVG